MTVGCTLPHEGALATPDALRTLARRAEELGFDHLWVGDHLVRPVQITSPYPYSASGAFGDERPFCEALTMLSHLAGCTQKYQAGDLCAHSALSGANIHAALSGANIHGENNLHPGLPVRRARHTGCGRRLDGRGVPGAGARHFQAAGGGDG